jgi:hypothetical protein
MLSCVITHNKDKNRTYSQVKEPRTMPFSTYDDRIVKYIDRTSSAVLKCEAHPHLRWHTKNISFIGARTVFYYPDENHGETECQCRMDLMQPCTEDEALAFYTQKGFNYYGITPKFDHVALLMGDE